MSAVSILEELIGAVQIIIFAGVGFRVVFCLVKMISDPDEYDGYKKKLKNALVFGILAISVMSIKSIVFKYFGG